MFTTRSSRRDGAYGRRMNPDARAFASRLNLMLSKKFESWHDTVFQGDPKSERPLQRAEPCGARHRAAALPCRSRNGRAYDPGFLSGEESCIACSCRIRGISISRSFIPGWCGKNGGRSGELGSVVQSRRRAAEDSAEREAVSDPELSLPEAGRIDARTLTNERVPGRGGNAHLTGRASNSCCCWSFRIRLLRGLKERRFPTAGFKESAGWRPPLLGTWGFPLP